jgi:hypothetical protein
VMLLRKRKRTSLIKTDRESEHPSGTVRAVMEESILFHEMKIDPDRMVIFRFGS